MLPLVMITGASAGIGAATAQAFSRAGHPLLLLARLVERLQALELPNAVKVQADVRDRDAVAAAIAAGERRYGPVDCLVNNAGIAPLAKLEDQDPAAWRELLDINCLGVMNCMHALIPAMKARRHGSVVNVSSIAGRKAYPAHDAYGASKYFVHGLSEAARANLADHNVRVIVVSPGLTASDIGDTMHEPNAKAAWSRRKQELGGGIEAEHVANTIVFAYQMPQHVILQELTITPTGQSY